ncbi:hypothetical protein JCM5353_007302 [Sporobolomyces roseus]
MSNPSSRDNLASTIISAEPPPAVIASLESHSMGLIQRKVLEEDVARIRESLQINEVSSYNFPLVAAVAPDSWRNVEEQSESEIKLFDASTDEQRLAKFIKDRSVVTKEDLGSAMLVLLDGQARLKVLLEVYDPEKPRRIFLHLYTSGIFERAAGKFNQPIFELLHGTNLRQVFLSNPTTPDLADQVRQLHMVRDGSESARPCGTIDNKIAPAFFGYISSRSRSTLAAQVLTSPFLKPMLRSEKPTRLAALFQQFGAATPVLFHAIKQTETTLNSLDPNNPSLDPNFFFYLSLLINSTEMENPLSIHPLNPAVHPQTRCTAIATVLRRTIDTRIKPQGTVELNGFTSVFSKRMPAWIGGDPSLELAEDIVQRFEVFIENLQNPVVSKDLQPRPQRFFCNYIDLISLNFQTEGTELVRWMALLETFFLTPLAEMFQAYVQLSRDDPTLSLPTQYWQTFKDPEPFFIELVAPGKGLSVIKAGKRKVKNLGPWAEPVTTKNQYYRFTRRLWYTLRDVVYFALQAKARLASLSQAQRAQLLASLLDPVWKDTPQAAVIEDNLYLALFKVKSDRTLEPAIVPRSFSRCNVWLRPDLTPVLRTLADTDENNEPTIFTSFLHLVNETLNPNLDNALNEDLTTLLDETLRQNKEGIKLKDLSSNIEETVLEIESLKIDTLLEPLPPNPPRPEPTPPVPLAEDTPHYDAGAAPEGAEVAVEVDSKQKGKKRARSEDRDEDENEKEPGNEKVEGEGNVEGEPAEAGEGEKMKEVVTGGQGAVGGAAGGATGEATGEATKKIDEVKKPPEEIKKKKRKKLLDPDGPYIPPRPPRPRAPPDSPQSPQLPLAADIASTLILSEEHLFPTPTASPSKPKSINNVASWSNPSSLVEPETIATEASAILSNASPLAIEILRRFRDSNHYPPLGHSFDRNTFDIDKFHNQVANYMYSLEQAEPYQDPNEDEETDDIESSLNGITSTRIFLRITDVILEVLECGKRDQAYDYWRKVENGLRESNE